MDHMVYLFCGAAIVLAIVWAKSRYLSFAAQKPADYNVHTGDRLDVRTHLNGPILCDGVIYGPTGRVVSRFVGDFEASWTDNTGEMTENFHYDSGKIQRREWKLAVDDSGRISGSAPDLIGKAYGQQSGAAACLNYKIRLDEDAGGHVLTVRDWMYLAPNGTIVNRSQFRKYGLKVGELVATMRRKDSV